MKNLKNLGKALTKAEQKLINGGDGCIIYPPSKCLDCGGHPLSNGCCLGTVFTHECLGG